MGPAPAGCSAVGRAARLAPRRPARGRDRERPRVPGHAQGHDRTVREQFPQHRPLFAGWATPPTDSADPNDPLPVGTTTPFDPNMARAIVRVEKTPQSFPDDDGLGLYVQTSSRPTADNPFARSDDPTTGIHNYIHSRFQDQDSPVDMGNPLLNLGNQRFWRLHGWIDRYWGESRRVAGRSDADPAFRAAIDAEKHHLEGHMPGMMRAFALPVGCPADGGRSGVPPQPVPRHARQAIPRVDEHRPPADDRGGSLRDYLAVAVRLEHFTIPLYLTAFWSLVPGPRPTSTEASFAVWCWTRCSTWAWPPTSWWPSAASRR